MRAVLLAVAVVVTSSWALALLNGRGGEIVDDRVVAPARYVTSDVSLRSRLSDATVTWGDDPAAGFTGGRWVVGKEPWLWVGPYRGLLTVSGLENRQNGPSFRPCIWAHAAGPATGPKARPLRIVFKDLPGAGRLHGEVGLLDVPREGAQADFSVQVGSTRPVRVPLTDTRGERRWRPWEITTTGGPVTFEISAQNPDWRQVCFTAYFSSSEAAP